MYLCPHIPVNFASLRRFVFHLTDKNVFRKNSFKLMLYVAGLFPTGFIKKGEYMYNEIAEID